MKHNGCRKDYPCGSCLSESHAVSDNPHILWMHIVHPDLNDE